MKINNQIPNTLILSNYNTSVIQRRIVYSILMQIEKVMEYTPANTNLIFKIPKNIIMDGYSFTNLKDGCKALIQKAITVTDDDLNEEFDYIMPFSRITVTKESHFMEVSLNVDMAKIFYEIKKGYSKIDYNSALLLTSSHAQKLYEIFSMKINNFESTIWFTTVDEIKGILGLEDKYSNNKDFRKRILDTTKEQLKHTNLTVEYELEKEGKSYHHLTFYINLKSEKSDFEKIEATFLDDKSKRCLERLNEIGITNKDLQNRIVKEHQDEFWKWNYAVKTNKISIKTNVAGHLLKTLGLV